MTQGKQAVLTLLRDKYPQIYAHVLKRRPDLVESGTIINGSPGNPVFPSALIKGLGATAPPTITGGAPATTTWYDDIFAVIKEAVPVYQQQQLFKLQLKRAEQGLQPIDPGLVAPQFNISLPPEQRKQLNYLVFGALGLGVILLLTRKQAG